MPRVFFIGFTTESAGGTKDQFVEGEYYDESGHMVRGPVCASKDKTARALGKGFLAGEGDAVIGVDVVGGGGVGSVVYEPIHAEEDGGATWGLFGTRAAAASFIEKKKAESGGGGDEFTLWEIREHVVA